MKSKPVDPKRRRFLLAAGAGGAGAALLAARGGREAPPPAPAAEPAGDARGAGYQETGHVRNYYRTTRV